MDKIIQILKINWVHQLIGACFFVLGVILGAIAVSVIWKKFTLRDKKENKIAKDISYITQNAISAYENGNSKLELEKITYICEAITYLLEKIPQEYGNSKTYDIIAKEDFKIKDKEVLLSNLKLQLDFTVYELLNFINGLVGQFKGEVYRFLNSSSVKFALGAGKLLLKNKMQEEDRHKQVEDITIENFRKLISSFLNKESLDKEKEDGQIKSFFKSVASKAGAIALNMAKKVANPIVDEYVKEFIEIFASELNKLYSGQHKDVSLEVLDNLAEEVM